MKVLYVSEYWKPKVMGGGEISGDLLAENLAARGVDVSVLTSRFPDLEEYETAGQIKVHRRLTTGGDPQSLLSNLKRAFSFSRSIVKELPRLCSEEDYDIIHSLNVTSLVGVSEVRQKINKPIVAHINSPTPFCPRGLLLKGEKECSETFCDYATFKRCLDSFGSVSRMNVPFLLRRNPAFRCLVYRNYGKKKEALKRFDHYMPISSFIKKLLLRDGIPEEKIDVVPNMIEMEKFMAIPEERHEVPRILYLGSYAEYKGPQVLLKALKGLKEKYECSFYGKGPLKGEMIRFVRENGLTNVSVNDEVPQSKINETYRKHDIVVFPSLVAEAFGRVALEALASGRPVIASAVGGVTDIVEDGKTGLLCRPGDVEGLREAIRKLISDPGMRQEFARRGRETAAGKFSAQVITGRVIETYKKVLNEAF